MKGKILNTSRTAGGSARKRHIIFLAFVFALLLAFSCAAFAAAGSDGGGGFNLWGFIKSIFVPGKDYFQNKMAVLNDKINRKLGGVAYLYLMINYFFKTLDSVPGASIKFSLPNGYFYQGYTGMSVDLLSYAGTYVKVLKDVLTASYCLFIAIVCYHKLRKLFSG